METISFYSYKGGVGRTLLVANTARYLSLSGYKVVLLDLDLEAPGLLFKLDENAAEVAAKSGELYGVVDHLVEVLERNEPPRTIAARALTIATPPDSEGSIQLLAAGCAPHGNYWKQLERLSEVRRAREAGGGLTLAVLDLAARIEDELEADYLLIDARTGVTELGGLATTALADRVVCLSLLTSESIEGTRAVLGALRSAPRPPRRAALSVDVLFTRTGDVPSPELELMRLLLDLETPPAVLRHDDTGVEAKLHMGAEHVAQRRSGLLADTVQWLERAFPNAATVGLSAAQRMRAIDKVVEALTEKHSRPTPSHDGGDPWSLDQIRSGVTFVSRKTKRFADLVLYLDAKASTGAKPDMVVEYVGNAAPDPIASWWLHEVEPRAVCLLVCSGEDRFERRLFTANRGYGGVTRSQRWSLPAPTDFKALDDVGDLSTDAQLAALARGNRRYAYSLVRDWVLSTEVTVHGGMPWRPAYARTILDGFVSAKKDAYVLSVLHGDWICGEHWGVMNSGHAIAERVAADLLAPVWWRTNLESAVSFDHQGPHHGRPLAVHAFVATRLMGLRYDPDDQFRRDAGALVRTHAPPPASRGAARDGERIEEYPIHGKTGAFEGLELKYDLDASASGEMLGGVVTRLGLARRSEEPPNGVVSDLVTIVRALRANSLLATVGVLGTYEAETSTLRFYRAFIAAAANALGVDLPALERVVHMHLAVLAYAHLGRDADGRMWETFALPREIGQVVQPGTNLTTIAQYFVWRLIERLDDPALRDAFVKLTDAQPLAYRRWRGLVDVPIEDVRAWLMTLRRGGGSDDAARVAMLVHERDHRH